MKELYKALNDYYQAVGDVGNIHKGVLKDILILDFITSVHSDPDYLLHTTTAEQSKINRLYTKIIEKQYLLC